jgi:hypothetical protein
MDFDRESVDWSNCYETDRFSLSCPFCGGEGRKKYDELDKDEKEEVVTEFIEEELGDRDLDKVEEQEIEDWYNQNACDFEFYCEHCNDGYIEPIWDYVWHTRMTNVSDETIKEIMDNTNCLCLYDDDNGDYVLTLSGCGMDLCPDLCYATILLGFKWIPISWAREVRADYSGGISEENHKEVVKMAISTLDGFADEFKQEAKKLKKFSQKKKN